MRALVDSEAWAHARGRGKKTLRELSKLRHRKLNGIFIERGTIFSVHYAQNLPKHERGLVAWVSGPDDPPEAFLDHLMALSARHIADGATLVPQENPLAPNEHYFAAPSGRRAA